MNKDPFKDYILESKSSKKELINKIRNIRKEKHLSQVELGNLAKKETINSF